MGRLTRFTGVALLAALASGCSVRERVDQLQLAEARYQRVCELQGQQAPPPTPPTTAVLYEAGVVVPASYLVAFVATAPVALASEVVQLTLLPVYYGQQDPIADATVAAYRRGPSFWRMHGLFPRASGGASLGDDPDPSRPWSPRGDRPQPESR